MTSDTAIFTHRASRQIQPSESHKNCRWLRMIPVSARDIVYQSRDYYIPVTKIRHFEVEILPHLPRSCGLLFRIIAGYVCFDFLRADYVQQNNNISNSKHNYMKFTTFHIDMRSCYIRIKSNDLLRIIMWF